MAGVFGNRCAWIIELSIRRDNHRGRGALPFAPGIKVAHWRMDRIGIVPSQMKECLFELTHVGELVRCIIHASGRDHDDICAAVKAGLYFRLKGRYGICGHNGLHRYLTLEACEARQCIKELQIIVSFINGYM